MKIKKQLLELLKITIGEFVNEDYEKLKLKLESDIDIVEIKEVLSHWDKLTTPPKSVYENTYFYKYEDGSGFALDFDLWIDDEESDLTLSCSVIVDERDNVLSFTIEDLHTL
jgi:hypothetical protein